jgi:hypothetical protein
MEFVTCHNYDKLLIEIKAVCNVYNWTQLGSLQDIISM